MSDEIQIVGVTECLNNSKELLESAKILFENKKTNHAYHLATLALEEIGKSELVLISQLPSTKNKEAFTKKYFDDHVKKLFWAFFGPMFGEELLTKDSIENTSGLAKEIHATRMKSLYVDVTENEVSNPQKIDILKETESLIKLVEARFNLENYQKQFTVYKSNPKLLQWFVTATDDDDKRKRILNSSSMKKLVEFGDVKEWIKWLKELFENAEKENRKFVESELNKSFDQNENEKPKWKIKYRLYSDSHTIKQKELNEWNKNISSIKLQAVSDKKHKQELLVEIISPESVHIKKLFHYSWMIQRTFLLAINIGSLGFFWWDIPKYRSKFYESAYDLERKTSFTMEVSPKLKIDWKKGALSENELKQTMVCFSQIYKIKTEDNVNPTNYYFGGLVFMGLNNLNFRSEDQSFTNFYLCFKYSLSYYKIWDGKNRYLKVFTESLMKIGFEQEDVNKFYKMGEGMLNKKYIGNKITLEEVGMMKIACDAFFINKFGEFYTDNKEV